MNKLNIKLENSSIKVAVFVGDYFSSKDVLGASNSQIKKMIDRAKPFTCSTYNLKEFEQMFNDGLISDENWIRLYFE